MNTTKIYGQLEIDHDRGVIYFHRYQTRYGGTGITVLRIGGLPPITKTAIENGLDITHNILCSWETP